MAADSAARNYGQVNPGFTGTIAGVQSGDLLSLAFSTAAVPNSPAGTYPITVTVVDPGEKISNYAVTSTAGVLTVRDRIESPGVAHDGYVAAATVFFDANRNSVKDANEPSTQTDDRGNFTLILGSQFDTDGDGLVEPSEGSIVLTGGVDIATGLPMRTALTAPPGSTVVNPLTTILTEILAQNPGSTVAGAQAQLAAALNIPAGVNLTTYDPLAGALASDPSSTAVLKAGAKVQDTLVQVSALLQGASSQPQAQVANAAVRVMAEKVSSGQSLDLTQSSTVQSVIQRTGQDRGTTLSAAVQESTANVIANGNQIKDDAAARAGSQLEASREITRTQVITQGEVALALTQIGTSPSTAAAALPGISGTSFLEKVQAAPVGDVQGDDVRPGTFSFGQPTFRLQTSNPDLANVTVYRTFGNRGQVSLTIALGIDAGPARATVPVTFADREISKTVDLAAALRSDYLLASQPSARLGLLLPSNAPPLAFLGAQSTATLTKIAPTITQGPSDQVAIRGNSFSLAVSATPRHGRIIDGERMASIFSWRNRRACSSEMRAWRTRENIP